MPTRRVCSVEMYSLVVGVEVKSSAMSGFSFSNSFTTGSISVAFSLVYQLSLTLPSEVVSLPLPHAARGSIVATAADAATILTVCFVTLIVVPFL